MKALSIASLCFVIVGCAASNGGGHVVGNPMMPAEYSDEKIDEAMPCSCGAKDHSQCTCGDKDSCSCKHPPKAKKKK